MISLEETACFICWPKTAVFVCTRCLVVGFNELYVNFSSSFDLQLCADWNPCGFLFVTLIYSSFCCQSFQWFIAPDAQWWQLSRIASFLQPHHPSFRASQSLDFSLSLPVWSWQFFLGVCTFSPLICKVKSCLTPHWCKWEFLFPILLHKTVPAVIRMHVANWTTSVLEKVELKKILVEEFVSVPMYWRLFKTFKLLFAYELEHNQRHTIK